ncbi:ABC transporter substrate-binding protein [Brevibacillus sp. NRS-1366]|uniref:ABC transporter substrate-binding protein n=1 Tax=Brevibacillus sp. NRS-1366 TaxID=3233899 RepID=UPI003D1B5BB1
MRFRKLGIFMIALTLVSALIGCSDKATNTNNSDETNKVSGGVLRVAEPTSPPTLDPHISTSTLVTWLARNNFETLVTLNSKGEPKPFLADSIEQSEDRKEYTFHLRKGVTFHNNKEMKAEDVVASMNRWKELSPTAKTILGKGDFEVKDEYTVTLKLNEPSSLVLFVLSGITQAPYIMPKKVIDAADPTSGVKEFIGTGPFKFVEWKQDQYIHFTKYKDYKSVDLPADGLTGKKEALLNDIYFDIVKDPSTRVAGLQSGQYDLIRNPPNELFERFKNDPDMQVYPFEFGPLALIFNNYQGPLADIKMRQAVNSALAIDDVLFSTFSNRALYKLQSSYMPKGIWYSDKGVEHFNKKDPQKVKRLLKEAGYNGEQIILMTTRDYSNYYNASLVVQQQLKEVGLNVKLEIYDWPTFTEKEKDPKNWHMKVLSNPSVMTPLEHFYYEEGYFDAKNEKIQSMLKAIRTAPTEKEAMKLWGDLQAYSWEFLPVVNLGYYNLYSASTKKVKGFTNFMGAIYWNTSVEK